MSTFTSISACIDPLCYLAAAMDVQSCYSEWSCTGVGATVGNVATWTGVTTYEDQITRLDLSTCNAITGALCLQYISKSIINPCSS